MIAIIVVILIKNKQDNIIIPKESIRIRIVANDNSEMSVNEKLKVKKSVERELYSLLKNANSKEEAQNIINDNLEKLNLIVEENTNQEYVMKFGNNYFPKKIYKGIIYEEGVYESLVITLGNGDGNNWWCVLFPPLCLLEGNENTSDVEYKFFIKEILDKYF